MRALVTAATAKAIGMDIQFERDLMQRVNVAEEDRNGQVRSPRGGDRSDNQDKQYAAIAHPEPARAGDPTGIAVAELPLDGTRDPLNNSRGRDGG
jgi:hypothetical protein